MDIFDKINMLQQEVNDAVLNNAEETEKFRIRFLGSKNILKDIFSEIKNVANERKKEFGQVVNAVKISAEEKYATSKENIDNTIRTSSNSYS
jgi:phenylalanyl-tRNA synthetase alpha chain